MGNFDNGFSLCFIFWGEWGLSNDKSSRAQRAEIKGQRKIEPPLKSSLRMQHVTKSRINQYNYVQPLSSSNGALGGKDGAMSFSYGYRSLFIRREWVGGGHGGVGVECSLKALQNSRIPKIPDGVAILMQSWPLFLCLFPFLLFLSRSPLLCSSSLFYPFPSPLFSSEMYL